MPMLLYIAVLDPHLAIRGVGSNPDPYIRRGAVSKKIFLALRPQFDLKIRWICHCIEPLFVAGPFLMFFTPGTSDEHITVVENLRNYSPDGAILVTTPQV